MHINLDLIWSFSLILYIFKLCFNAYTNFFSLVLAREDWEPKGKMDHQSELILNHGSNTHNVPIYAMPVIVAYLLTLFIKEGDRFFYLTFITVFFSTLISAIGFLGTLSRSRARK